MIAMTIISSIKVKPCCFFMMNHLNSVGKKSSVAECVVQHWQDDLSRRRANNVIHINK